MSFRTYLLAATTFLLSLQISLSTSLNCLVPTEDKIDCGQIGTDENECYLSGCCWYPAGANSETPWCYKASSAAVTSYALSSLSETSTGFLGYLELLSSPSEVYGNDIEKLKLEILFESSDYMRIQISDASKVRWEIPQSIVERPIVSQQASKLNYSFKYTKAPFTFEITRNVDGATIFKSSEQLIFKDQFLQFTTETDTEATTFGIGESTRLKHSLTPGNTFTLWNADIPALAFNENLYGSFPYYLQMLKGVAHGALLFNSNGMDITIPSSNNEIIFKTVGGIIDLYVFTGPTPADVVSQYTSIVGRPVMMPYWSLGFHNCKYGYTSIQQVEEVVANYSAAGIPLETQWVDIDYMQDYKDFTTDAIHFPIDEMKRFVNSLHANNQQFIPIIDPGIMTIEGYPAYEQGMEKDVFIKDTKGNPYLGQVWPGPTFFPDFFNPEAQTYWTAQLESFHNQVPVDGIWIDMNEISNFCNVDGKGQSCSNTASSGCPTPGAQTTCCLECYTIDSLNKLDFPPYNIGNEYGLLSTKTISMSSQHYGNISEYNAHNLFGLTEQIATAKALQDITNKRPFLLTRSSFPGTGSHSAKWTGDNAATWNDLKSSIISIMDFNIFGIPMVGADICGFIYDTTEELCARWAELGSFYPFMRNHNALNNAPQEFYLWESVTDAAKKALAMRYRLLPFLYTLLYNAHVDGSTFARPLFFNFPNDEVTISIDEQFMLGNSLLISPALYPAQTTVNAYFPMGLWYDFKDLSLAVDASSGGFMKELVTSISDINVHLMGGNVLPLQQSAMTTARARETPFTLLAALCPKGKAMGTLYWDDGVQIDLKNFITSSYEVNTVLTSGNFTATAVLSDSTTESTFNDVRVSTIIILGNGLLPPSKGATINNEVIDLSNINFDEVKGILTFSGLNYGIYASFELIWE